MEKLVALVPPPRANTVHYHGVFAPRHAWRAEVLPKNRPAKETHDKLVRPQGGAPRSRWVAWACRVCCLKRVPQVSLLVRTCAPQGPSDAHFGALSQALAPRKAVRNSSLAHNAPPETPRRASDGLSTQANVSYPRAPCSTCHFDRPRASSPR